MSKAAKLRLAVQLNGSITIKSEPSGPLDIIKLGLDTDDIVSSEFGWRGGASFTDARIFTKEFSRAISDRFRPESEAFEDAWAARNSRALLGFKHDEDAEAGWWYTLLEGGFAGPSDEYWDAGKIDSAKGYFTVHAKHRNWWYLDTPSNIANAAAITNVPTANVRTYDYATVSGNGNISPILRVKITNGQAKKLRRIFIGCGRNSSVFNTLIGSWDATTVTIPYTTQAKQLTLSASTITVDNYPSGMARVVLMLAGAALSNGDIQFSVDGGKTWHGPCESGSNLVLGPIIPIRATRQTGLAGSNQSITLHVRNIGATANAAWPAGGLHLFPCDQANEFVLHTQVANSWTLVSDGRFDERYIQTGANTAEYDCVTRFGAPLSAPPGYMLMAFAVEDEDGRVDTFSGTLTIDAWARRRGITV